jgi:peptidylprolyl isomerase
MKKSLLSLGAVCACVLSATQLFAEPSTTAAQPSETAPNERDISRISEAFGHLIGKNIDNLGVKFDLQHLIKGLQDAAAGIDSPMTEAECVEALTAAQEIAFKEQASDNLKKAETFLSQNAKEKGVVEIEKGKVQYKIEKAGEGSEVQEHDSPLIRYCGKFLDGSAFGSSKEDEMVSLDETIPGLKSGLIGMKEGEKRILYIHPDLGYGTQGYLPPNTLLTFEVEIVKANVSQAAMNQDLPATAKTKRQAEIATPAVPGDALR